MKTKTLLKTLATELEYALEVFQEACQCNHCGPCKRQRRMKALITQSRNKKSDRIIEG